MKFVNIHDAKTHLSKYIEEVRNEHSTVIICRNGDPICQLTEYKKPKGIKFGMLQGQIKMSDDFDDELPDEFWSPK
jgi:prevent-host-death family protein